MFRFEQNGNLQLCIRSVSGVPYIHQIHQKSEPLTGFVRLYSKKETRQIKIRCQNLPEEPTEDVYKRQGHCSAEEYWCHSDRGTPDADGRG